MDGKKTKYLSSSCSGKVRSRFCLAPGFACLIEKGRTRQLSGYQCQWGIGWGNTRNCWFLFWAKFFISGLGNVLIPLCCHAKCSQWFLRCIPLQELSPHLCPCVFSLSVTGRTVISKILFLSQKHNLIPSNFSTQFFFSVIPQRKLVSVYNIFPLCYMNVIQRALLLLHRLSCFQMLHRSLWNFFQQNLLLFKPKRNPLQEWIYTGLVPPNLENWDAEFNISELNCNVL